MHSMLNILQIAEVLYEQKMIGVDILDKVKKAN